MISASPKAPTPCSKMVCLLCLFWGKRFLYMAYVATEFEWNGSPPLRYMPPSSALHSSEPSHSMEDSFTANTGAKSRRNGNPSQMSTSLSSPPRLNTLGDYESSSTAAYAEEQRIAQHQQWVSEQRSLMRQMVEEETLTLLELECDAGGPAVSPDTRERLQMLRQKHRLTHLGSKSNQSAKVDGTSCARRLAVAKEAQVAQRALDVAERHTRLNQQRKC
jgi:hypothetical protein